MRQLIRLAFFLPCLAFAADGSTPHFSSWYDGWGTHNVWGIGKVQGSFVGTHVTCGKDDVPVIAIYDTHADHVEPRADQSADFARRANQKLLAQFGKANIRCTFVLVGEERPDTSLERTRER